MLDHGTDNVVGLNLLEVKKMLAREGGGGRGEGRQTETRVSVLTCTRYAIDIINCKKELRG